MLITRENFTLDSSLAPKGTRNTGQDYDRFLYQVSGQTLIMMPQR